MLQNTHKSKLPAPIYLWDTGIKEMAGRHIYTTAWYACYCGDLFKAAKTRVKSGEIKSCGCGRKNTGYALKHGRVGTPEYKVWEGIKKRCYNKNTAQYMHYGGRGIGMSKRWFHSFEAFYNDMGDKPSSKHSIERIDSNKHYTPKNCRWATMREQANNKRTTCMVTYKGVTKALSYWCEELNIPRVRTYYRIFGYGWEVEKAFFLPQHAKARFN